MSRPQSQAALKADNYILATVAPPRPGGAAGLNYTDIPAGKIALRHASDLLNNVPSLPCV